MPRRRRAVRRMLLSALDAFLEGTPASLARAHRLIEDARRGWLAATLDDLVYGFPLTALTDSDFYDSPDYLRETREDLSGRTGTIHHAYVNYDYRPDFTPTEHVWFDRLRALHTFLARFPFAGDDSDAVAEVYEQRVEEISRLAAASPPPVHPGDERLHHLALREATALLTTIELIPGALRHYTHPIPRATYTAYRGWQADVRERVPNLSGALPAADRLLRAIVAEGWLIITYQLTPAHYVVSFH
jgi:hypothetical protein